MNTKPSMRTLGFRLCALSAAAVLAVASTPTTLAGAFVFADESDPGTITHPTGYTGSGGTVNVSVCIDPGSVNAAAMEIPVRNAIRTWNMRIATTGNLLFDGNNNVPSGQNDFESAVLHEIGHCIGLAHVNLATESGLPAASRDYTKSTDGADDAYGLNAGADGTIGSADDMRGDDGNLHWYVDADNDPCSAVVGTSDNGTMSRGLGNLPGGDLFAANGDRTVCSDLGYANTEAVMQQGQGQDEDQRALGGDDVRTLRFAMAGVDEDEGTGDDYTISLSYAGMTTACTIPIDFDDGETGFAVCQAEGQYFDGVHAEITKSEIYFNTGGSWFFNDVLASEPPVCDDGGPYTVECQGTSTSLMLDATGSSDPEDGTNLTYAWTTDCPGGTFDDDTSATPTLTLDSAGCSTSCTVDLTVTDTGNLGTDCGGTMVTVVDTATPMTTCPSDTTIECDQPTDPSNTGTGASIDICDPSVAVSYADTITPGACPQEMTIDRDWTGTDDCGLTDTCGQRIEVVDTMAPTIELSVTPDVLWPPNHKMWTIDATVLSTDNCDDDPNVTLVSIVSDEPDDDGGDGDFPNDVQDADFGTDDRQFLLRAERSGTGDGRVYTIVYQADDGCGNATPATAEVRVPHDQSGHAMHGVGFTEEGTALESAAAAWGLVIPSHDGFDSTLVDVGTVYVGNHVGVQVPIEARIVSLEGYAKPALFLLYDANVTRAILQGSPEPVGAHYQAEGIDYAVPDVFALPVAPDPVPEQPDPNPLTRPGGGSGSGADDLGRR